MSATTARTQDSTQEQMAEQREIVAALQGVRIVADSALVSRTRRVVQERALAMQAQRRRTRDIWLACSICSALLIVMTHSLWNGLMQFDATSDALPNSAQMLDGSAQLLVMMLWFLPVTAAVMALAVFKRTRNRRENERLEHTGYAAVWRRSDAKEVYR